MHTSPRRATSLALAVFCLLAGVYLLTSGGHTYTIDEEMMFRTAGALVRRGSFMLSAGDADSAPEYSKYGPAQPIAAVPLYAAGHALAQLFPPEAYNFVTRALVVWFNPFVTAGVAALLVLAALRLGYSARVALGTALIYGLGTMAWPQSKTFFAEPLTALLQFGACYLILVARGRAGAGRPWPLGLLALSGALAGIAPVVKIQAGLALPVIGLWLLGLLLGGRPLPPLGQAARRLLRPSLAWGLPALLALSLQPLYQWLVFGSPLRSGYDTAAEPIFGNNPLVGLFGLIASSGKGIIWYAPPLILLPLGLWLLRRRDRGVAAICAAMTLSHLLFYAVVFFWHGDVAWGPRYLNIILPFMSLPLAALLAAAARRPPLRLALAGSLAAAVPVQVAALTISMNAYVSVQPDEDRRIWVPAEAPILGHLRLLGENLRLLYELHLAPESAVLRSGFWYSEGSRVTGAQLPRWTQGRAEIALRPPPGRPVRLSLSVTSCWAQPRPTSLALWSEGRVLASQVPCPPRRYELLLPPGRRSLQLMAETWDPIAAGVDRDGPLGLVLDGVSARAGDTALTVRGALLPPPPAPPGRIMLRRWFSDHRYAHWDHWAWFFVSSGLPARPLGLIAGLWLTVSLGLIGGGAALARRALGDRPAEGAV